MNEDTVKGKWTEIKGDIQNAWGKLSHDDLESTKGNISAIAGLIQQRYGETKETVMEKLNGFFGRAEDGAKGAGADAAQWTAKKTEDAKETLRDTPVPGSRH